MEHLLSVHQVAAIMGIHHKKVQRLARTGAIPSIKIGAVYRFRETTLEAWMEDNEVSKRQSAEEDTQERRASLGVSLSRLDGAHASEDADLREFFKPSRSQFE